MTTTAWKPGNVLIGPPWKCPDCNKSVAWMTPATEIIGGFSSTQVGEYDEVLVYLAENDCQHTKRAVRLGNAICLVEFANGGSLIGHPDAVVETMRRIKAALAHIRETVTQDDADPIAETVYRLVRGELTPGQAITILQNVASLSPLDGEGGAADAEAAPPEPLFKGAPEKALRDMTADEIKSLTPEEFMAAQLEDNCAECPEAPRSTCPHRSRCDAETYG